MYFIASIEKNNGHVTYMYIKNVITSAPEQTSDAQGSVDSLLLAMWLADNDRLAIVAKAYY